MGGETAASRERNVWSLPEYLKLLKLINDATGAKILKKKRTWVFSPNPEDDKEGDRFTLDKKTNVITIN